MHRENEISKQKQMPKHKRYLNLKKNLSCLPFFLLCMIFDETERKKYTQTSSKQYTRRSMVRKIVPFMRANKVINRFDVVYLSKWCIRKAASHILRVAKMFAMTSDSNLIENCHQRFFIVLPQRVHWQLHSAWFSLCIIFDLKSVFFSTVSHSHCLLFVGCWTSAFLLLYYKHIINMISALLLFSSFYVFTGFVLWCAVLTRCPFIFSMLSFDTMPAAWLWCFGWSVAVHLFAID